MLRLNTNYEFKVIQRAIWTSFANKNPVRVRLAGDREWSKELSASVVRTKYGAGRCDVYCVIHLPTEYEGELRTARVRMEDLQSVHADIFFKNHYIRFVPEDGSIVAIGIKRLI